MPLPPRRERAKALARTYGGDRDPWERVGEFQRVLEYRGEHPNKGSSAVASALDLPRSRIRPWFDGSKPDPVHAIDAAEARGWLDAGYGEPVFAGLDILHAWILAGGSIDVKHYVPSFVESKGDLGGLCRRALAAVGVDVRDAHSEVSHRATEIRPREAGTALGRFLHSVLGAPVGGKHAEAELSIPEWLLDAPDSTRLRWARTYVTLRGTDLDARHGYTLRLGEDRSRDYRRAVATVLMSLVDDGLIQVTDRDILLRPDATDRLNQQPSLTVSV